MTQLWLGIDADPDIELEIRFAFVKDQSVATPSPDVVYLDVGGRLCPGILDHHQGSPAPCSATRLVVQNPEFVFDHLVPPWRAAARSRIGANGPLRVVATIAMHEQPDLDALLASYLAACILRSGGLPRMAETLAALADRVDQGAEDLVPGADGEPTLYAMILALSHELARRVAGKCLEEGRRDSLMRELGFQLIEDWIAAGYGAASSQPAGAACSSTHADWLRLDDELIRAARDGLCEDRGRFMRLVESGDITALEDIPIVGKTMSEPPRPVSAAAIPSVVECWFNKHFLRAGTGAIPPAVLTLIAKRAPSDRRCFVIALKPHGCEGGLAGLGAALELRETSKREQLGLTGERAGEGRFPEFPGVRDPWYDGRGHAQTIVESPKCGTVLEYEEVLEVLRSSFWEPDVGKSVVYGFRESGAEVERSRSNETTRLDALRAQVERARNTRSKEEPDFLLVTCSLHKAWGFEPLEGFAAQVCGASPIRLMIGKCEYFVGSRGILSNGQADPGLHRPVLSQIGRVVRLLSRLRALERQLGQADSGVGGAAYRGMLREHVRDVASFHSRRGDELPAELLSFVGELERQLDVEARTQAVGRLLEHVNEDAERRNGVRLNRLVFFVALFGVLEAAVALWPDWDEEIRVAFIVIVIFAIASFVRGIQSYFARLPVLGPMLFDDR